MAFHDVVGRIDRMPLETVWPAARFWLTRRQVAGGMLALGAVSALPLSALAAESIGKVSTAQGTSTGLLEGIITELESGSDIFMKQIVQTGDAARLAIALGADTTLKLGERTRVRIDETLVGRGGEIVLASGAMLFERPDSGGHGEVTVNTPFAVIAARGTTFWNGPSNDVVGVFVQSGEVTVRNRGGGVTLRAGEGTDLTGPDAAPTAPKAWGEARIAAAFATVN
jgi:ferric-dicitrate binding protein FerR (iron transport regulator)